MTDAKLRSAAEGVLFCLRHPEVHNAADCYYTKCLEAALAEPEEPKVERGDLSCPYCGLLAWTLEFSSAGLPVHKEACPYRRYHQGVMERPIPAKSKVEELAVTLDKTAEEMEWLNHPVYAMRYRQAAAELRRLAKEKPA